MEGRWEAAPALGLVRRPARCLGEPPHPPGAGRALGASSPPPGTVSLLGREEDVQRGASPR